VNTYVTIGNRYRKFHGKSVLLLIPFRNQAHHPLSKYIGFLLGVDYPFKSYYYDPLEKLFSKVIVYDYISKMLATNTEEMNRDLIDVVAREKPDYVLWVSMNYEFFTTTFDAIRNLGSQTIGTFFDDEWRFDEYSSYWAKHLDYCVTNDVSAVEKYSSMGVRSIPTVPCSVMPVNLTRNQIGEKYDVSFVGGRKYDRSKYISDILSKNLLANVFGDGWEDFGGKYISFSEMIDVFQKSKINLNFTKTEHGKFGWKGRMLQICGSGGFLLTEPFPGIENYFKVGKEIVCFKDSEELVSKIRYYLNHDDERREIARNGWKRVVGEYTPYHVMDRIFTEIEKSSNISKKAARPSRNDEIPISLRRKFSNYHFILAVALSLANHGDKAWLSELKLSLKYNPSNIFARFYFLIGYSPNLYVQCYPML